MPSNVASIRSSATYPSLFVPYHSVLSIVFDIHSGCSCLSFQSPSLQPRRFSLPLERCRSRGWRSRKEISKLEPLPFCRLPVYPVSLLSPNSREPPIAHSPRSRPGVADVSRDHFPVRSGSVTEPPPSCCNRSMQCHSWLSTDLDWRRWCQYTAL